MDTVTNSVEELYNRFHTEIVQFFADHLAERETAWDLCHEVFVRLLVTLAAGTQIQHPQGWLMRVAKNLLIDTYRHRQTARAANLPLDSYEATIWASDAATFRTLLQRADMLHVLVEALNALPEKYRRLLFWREIERLPLQEITLRTGTQEAALSTELWRARKLLQKEYLRRHFEDVLAVDEEIFDHLDALLRFNVTAAPEEQLLSLKKHERAYFDQIAPTWDDYVASAYEADLQERLTRLLPWHQDMTVLDAGTGTGYLAGVMAPLVGEVIGVDCSPAMLTRAGEKMAQAGYQQVTLRDGLAEQLPLATDSVDVAMCHMLLHHVVSPRTVLRELRRVVRPGGYMVIIDVHAHKQHWTPEAFGDLHYGTNLKKLRQHVSALQIQTLQVGEAGVSRSGISIGNDATFPNFLLLGQVGEQYDCSPDDRNTGGRFDTTSLAPCS
jgi:RNA polymerase sigma factor (sigma-70 family)